MVDLISDVVEDRYKEKINDQYIEWSSIGAFLSSIIKKNKMLVKVYLMDL